MSVWESEKWQEWKISAWYTDTQCMVPLGCGNEKFHMSVLWLVHRHTLTLNEGEGEEAWWIRYGIKYKREDHSEPADGRNEEIWEEDTGVITSCGFYTVGHRRASQRGFLYSKFWAEASGFLFIYLFISQRNFVSSCSWSANMIFLSAAEWKGSAWDYFLCLVWGEHFVPTCSQECDITWRRSEVWTDALSQDQQTRAVEYSWGVTVQHFQSRCIDFSPVTSGAQLFSWSGPAQKNQWHVYFCSFLG